MPNAAVLVGNTCYLNLQPLECCRADVAAMKDLLNATGKYENITVIENKAADALKSEIRAAIDKVPSPEELFFYFTGHGHQHETQFFLCATNFDCKRPNETGLSKDELYTLLRLPNAGLIVNVLDACYSGTLLIKSETAWVPVALKEGIRNLLVFASSLDWQHSLTGHPLSAFTENFRDAALRKLEGIVYYTDISNTLRDVFIDNQTQTPYFISQATAREQFIDDAKKLDALRNSLQQERVAVGEQSEPGQHLPAGAPSLLERLQAADRKVVTPERMSNFVDMFLKNLLDKITTSEFADFFDTKSTEHASFEERTAEKFIIGVLSNENRADNFVTASHTREFRGLNALTKFTAAWDGKDMFDERWELRLNCAMSRAQLRVTFTPKFMNLKQIILVVSCAPSLDFCYLFEITTQHMLRDFGKFNPDGPEISRRWWKIAWSETTEGVAHQIAAKLAEAVRKQLEEAEKRLASVMDRRE
jgi:hypothetical protein